MTDAELSRALGNIEGKVEMICVEVTSLRADISEVDDKIDTLPCSVHGQDLAKLTSILDLVASLPAKNTERIARLEVKAGLWGAVGGLIASTLAAVTAYLGLRSKL